MQNRGSQLQQRTKIAIRSGRERKDQAAIVGTVIRRMATHWIDPCAHEVESGLRARVNVVVEWSTVNLSETQRPQQQMENHALVVEGMLLRNTIRRDLVENCFMQQMRAEILPNLRLPQFWIQRSRRPKTDGLADQMIAPLGAGVTECLCGAPGMRCDHGYEQSYALVRGRWRMNQGVQRERPGKNSQ
jgi:hypothetical protein